jgi:CPA2 family monovalent cation:H+ antiporter-2
LQTSPRDLIPVAGIAAALAVIGVGTKMLTGYLAARSAGVGSRGRLRAAVALIPHGEFSIVIAGLAVAAGLNSQLATLAAAYVLALAILGPLLARGPEHVLAKPRPTRAAASSEAGS